MLRATYRELMGGTVMLLEKRSPDSLFFGASWMECHD
jgi:hypothetical protein